MKLTLSFGWVILNVGCFLIWKADAVTNYSQPILPEQYSPLIAEGFATNWFKSGFKTNDKPLSKYQKKNIDDAYDAGFRNMRLRCLAEHNIAPYNTTRFTSFLNDLETVVDDCLSVGIIPIISWENHRAEANASEEERINFISWWTKIAERLKTKDYRLSFNLYTELGIDVCRLTDSCELSLKKNTTKYNIWTSEVVNAIRGTGMNNEKRIIILGSPEKLAKGLVKIDESIYKNDDYMMVEWHIYASGPCKKPGSPKYWEGNGTTAQRQTLLDDIAIAEAFPLKSYFGAWMPQDNIYGHLNQTEVENFARYFVETLKRKKLPWSINVLDVYYNTKKAYWRTDLQTIQGQDLYMYKVFDVIKNTM